jgi:hypothetical protein
MAGHPLVVASVVGFSRFSVVRTGESPGPLYQYKRFAIDEMLSCITKGERISATLIGDMDELERGRKHLEDAQKYHWKLDSNVSDIPEDELLSQCS